MQKDFTFLEMKDCKMTTSKNASQGPIHGDAKKTWMMTF